VIDRLRAVLSQRSGFIGASVLLVVFFVVVFGPLLTPYSPTSPVGPSGAPPGSDFLLGTDFLGRDVLSRVLEGGLSVVSIGLGATLIAYVVGLATGVSAGYFGGAVDNLLMRAVDVSLAFPPLLVILLLIGAFENHIWVLVLGVVLTMIPGIARLARASAVSVSKQSYVEVAKARGDGYLTIFRRDVLVNILSNVLADFGIRFGWAIILVASLNFLGLGLAPPAADWGLMITENRPIIVLNAMSVVAPAIALGLLTIGVNLVSDAYLRAITGEYESGRFLARIMKRRTTRNGVAAATTTLPVPTEEAHR
jgi:peptide/nickel transport system permease protein